MLTNCLKVDALLTSEWKFYRRLPKNSCGFYMTVLKCFERLVIVIGINNFKVRSRDIPWVLSISGEFDVLKLEIFFEVPHELATTNILQNLLMNINR